MFTYFATDMLINLLMDAAPDLGEGAVKYIMTL